MSLTSVATPDFWPETSGIVGHARATPEAFTLTTVPVTITRHFFERADQCATAPSEEGVRCL
jgi:hypothetical protein